VLNSATWGSSPEANFHSVVATMKLFLLLQPQKRPFRLHDDQQIYIAVRYGKLGGLYVLHFTISALDHEVMVSYILPATLFPLRAHPARKMHLFEKLGVIFLYR
jgi:hypothetical protein